MKEQRFIYVLIDPRNNRPFYVGQCKDVKKRLKRHIYDSSFRKYPRDFTVSDIIDVGLLPIINVVEELEINPDNNDEVVFVSSREVFWINSYSNEYKLDNLQNNEDGFSDDQRHVCQNEACRKEFFSLRKSARFCSDKCRVTSHRSRHKKEPGEKDQLPTGNELREMHKILKTIFKNPEFKEKQKKAFEDLFDFGVAKIDYRPVTEQSFDGEKQDKYVQDEPPQYQKPKALRSFNDLLTAAKSVTTRAEREAIAREASIHPKLTPGQKGMIQAKFPPLDSLKS